MGGFSAKAVARLFLAAAIALALSGQTEGPQPLTLLTALQSTLANHPALHIQEQQVMVGRGARQAAAGLFDTTVDGTLSQSRINTPLTTSVQGQAGLLGLTASNQATNLTTLGADATKEYRNGVTIGSSFTTTRTTDNVYNVTGANVSTLSFQVTVPLMRGRGRSAVDAQEIAAGIEVEAALLDLNQLISNLLANTASAYWTALAAEKNLDVARGSEARARVYAENVQTLIEAGRVPQVEINQVKSNLATRMAETTAAEQNLIAARAQLALAMGMSTDRMAGVGIPAEDFPAARGALENPPVQRFFDLALQRRGDFLAAKKREEEQRSLVAAARNATRRQLNLNLSSGYSSLAEGTGPLDFLSAPGRSAAGPDASAGITYRFPAGNHAALGALAQAQASVRQAELRTVETAQGIMAAVVTAAEGVRNAALQLEKTQEAVAFSQAALEGEREKYRLGAGQIVDVLTLEDRLTLALQTQVNADMAYAVALIQLRSATGTIVEPTAAVQSVARDTFLTAPAPGEVSRPAPPAGRR